MKKAIVILGIISALLVLTLAFASVVSADNGPHGNFGTGDTTSTTDSCAGCHRAHTGTADELLRWGPTQYDFCTTCHGPIGQGAVTNVVDGKIQSPGLLYGSTYNTSAQTDTSLGLNGGGFENMQLYIPATDSWGAWSSVTAQHRVQGYGGIGNTGDWTAWGGGNNSSGPGITGTLKCASCHNPHGSPNYRILSPGYKSGVAYATSWTSRAAVWSNVYIQSSGQEPIVGSNEIATGAHNYASKLNVYYDYGISDFCGGCHQQYLMNRANLFDAANPYDAFGDGNTTARYRHPITSKGYYDQATQLWVTSSGGFTADAAAMAPAYSGTIIPRALRRVATAYGGSRLNPNYAVAPGGNYNGTRVTCLTCHYAHGSAAKATGWAKNAAVRDVVNGTTGDNALLYLDNRGVCQGCHAQGPAAGQY